MLRGLTGRFRSALILTTYIRTSLYYLCHTLYA